MGGEDSKARVVEEMTAEGQVYRFEGGNKGGRCFLCEEVGHMAGFCPRNAWSKNRKNGFKGEGWVGVGRGRGRCLGCGEEGHYVGQCLKASPRKCFSCREMGHVSLQCRRGPMCFGCRVGSHGSIMYKIKTFKRLRATRGGAFVARKVRNYKQKEVIWGNICFVTNKCIPGENVYQLRE